jgi:hypothetical protein
MEVNGIKMRRKGIIWGVLSVLCLLGTSYYAWKLYNAHCKQVEEWKEEAKAAFEEALWMEVNKRSEIPFYSYYMEPDPMGNKTLKTKVPDSVSVMTVNGLKKYKIDREKYENSLIKETRRRADLGALLEMYPLSIDMLTMHWDSLLSIKQVMANNQIRYIYTDFDLKNDTLCSQKRNKLGRGDSLTVKYLGFRCEYELVAYTSYPYWVLALSLGDWCWLLLPWVLLVLVVVFYASIERFLQRKFIKEKVVERKVHVADVKLEKAQTFLLSDGSVFDSFECTLTKGDQQYRFSNQSAVLLKLFLRKDNHRLSSADIDRELWNGKGTADQLYKAIQRLRVGLKNVSSDLVIKSINGDYELK